VPVFDPESPLHRVRLAVESLRREHGEAYVWRWRGDPAAAGPGAVARRFAARRQDWLPLLEAAEHAQAFLPGEAEATRAHFARAIADAELEEARVAIGGLAAVPVRVGERGATFGDAVAMLWAVSGPRHDAGRGVVDAISTIEPLLLDARSRADEAGAAVLGGPLLDAGPVREAAIGRSRRFLEDTSALATEARRWLFASADFGPGREYPDLLAALAHGGVRWPRESRFRRLAVDLRALGVERVLGGRARVEPDRPGIDPRARVVALRPPTDVRLAPSVVELGLVSELAAMDAVGRAFALASVSPGLPPAFRHPVVQSVGRAIGTLFAQLFADVDFLRRERGLDRVEAERVGRRAVAVLALEARLHHAAFIARAESREPGASRGRDWLRGRASEVLSSALGVGVPPILASLVAITPAALGPRAAARSDGLALARGMRERFDEDWFRNPRAHEPLEAAAGRGGTVAAHELAADLGADPAAAGAWLVERWG
jgi:hypothetical protein